MSKETETTIRLTLPELKDLRLVLEAWENEGFYFGRKDYFYKHMYKIINEVEKEIKYLEEQ